MANLTKRLPANVGMNFFVDSTCINCDTCRQLAPLIFREVGEYSAVFHQPEDDRERQAAYRALVACPVGAIGATEKNVPALRQAIHSFPLCIEGPVYYTGFNSDKSFGGNSYFIHHGDGNWLIDSPRYVGPLAEAFRRMGGIRYIFLTHKDDVADAGRYAEQFGAARIIHAADAVAAPGAEWLVEGDEPVRVKPQFRFIPVPGHTPGSLALLYDDRYLFSGDHLWWDREAKGLDLPSVYVWSEHRLRRSTARLLDYSFEWLLPGHGERVNLPLSRMREELHRLLARRRH